MCERGGFSDSKKHARFFTLNRDMPEFHCAYNNHQDEGMKMMITCAGDCPFACLHEMTVIIRGVRINHDDVDKDDDGYEFLRNHRGPEI